MFNNTLVFQILSMSFLPFCAIFGSACAALYMGAPLDPVVLGTAWAIVFGIYGLNKFTDVEDLVNNPEKRMFFKNNQWILYVVIGVLALSTLILFATHKFTFVHFVILFCGIAYSVKMLPFLRPDRTIVFKRLKELPFVKSLVVTITWGSAFFTIHLALYPELRSNLFEIVLFIISFSLSTFVNTNFLDIMDVDGDKISGIPTLPALFGIRNALLYVIGLPCAVWCLSIVFMYFTGHVSGVIAVALLLYALFPLVYICGYFYEFIPRRYLEIVADSHIFLFSVGIFLIYCVREQIINL